jgi:hypothetical protein
MNPTDPAAARKLVYTLLIVLAAGSVAGRIASANRVNEPEITRDPEVKDDRRGAWPAKRPPPSPTFSSNDRSRWATIRALVDEGTYVVGKRDRETMFRSLGWVLSSTTPTEAAASTVLGYNARVRSDRGIIFEPDYGSVDKVLNPETLEFYSSKPPLLSTLIAGLYWLLQLLTGWTLKSDPYAVVRTTLFLVNWLPFVIYLVLFSRLLERFGKSDWARYYVFAAACFATLLNPFAITLNNHSVATYSVLFALYAALSGWPDADNPGRRLSPLAAITAGLFAGFAVCNELPAAAFLAGLGVVLLWRSPKQTLCFFAPAALVPIAGLLLTNYIALGQLRPAYAEFGGPWYEYEGSHWTPPPEGMVKYGIDWARMHETRGEYAFHVLAGHHGLFSLTPIWLFSMIGMIILCLAGISGRGNAETLPPSTGGAGGRKVPPAMPVIGGLTLVLTVVVVGFYLVRSDNYGGWTSGLRWLMWLSPLWLLSMLPVAERLGRSRLGRGLAYVLLAVSVFSVNYRPWNPWRHPWLHNLMEWLGWPGYMW